MEVLTGVTDIPDVARALRSQHSLLATRLRETMAEGEVLTYFFAYSATIL